MPRRLVLLAGLVGARAQGQETPKPVSLDAFSYDRAAPLVVADSVVRVEDGITIHAISFPSPKGGSVTGHLFVPAGAGPFAGVVIQHGAPGRVDSTILDLLDRSVLPNAMTVARAGAVAVAVHAPWARHLRPPVTLTPDDSAAQVQLIVDLQRAVDLLVTRKDVDPSRLAYVGRSYGGAMGGLFSAVERRLRTVVLQVGDGGLVSHFTAAGRSAGPPPGVAKERWERWLAAMNPIEPLRFVDRITPTSVLLQSATRDEAVSVDLANQLHRAVSEPKKIIWYDTGHGLDEAAQRDMLAWLHETIGTAAPRD